ncbi:MAG: LacI family DNA-binding transcriptional regulator [Clostridia bacterium]|nr:LacI family DNA-binding transcriptional regulator [Clostridia bacterium]
MAVTIKDVSAKCGLSISTVSKAFNNYSDISAETRELVHRTAREIGYYPNAIARTLKTNRSYNLGVLYSDDGQNGLTHSFFAQVLDSFKCECEKHGYDLTFINHNVGWTGMTYLEHCRYRNVDGVCMVCADFYSTEVSELATSDIPCVTIDHAFNNRSCVMSDNLQGVQQLVHYAAEQGHRKIAFAHGQRSSVTENRITGYYRALNELNIEPRQDYLVDSLYDSPSSGYQSMMQLMRLPDPPTCVLLPDDQTALGAMEAANELGLRIPEDVSIAGYDGIRIGQMLRPKLTTVKQDTKRMGMQAALYLIDRIENPRTAMSEVGNIPVKLMHGESLGPVKG